MFLLPIYSYVTHACVASPSCDPNCELHRWNVNGRMRIGIFARRPIKRFESLSYDYQVRRQCAASVYTLVTG